MDEETFNLSLRKFFKTVGVNRNAKSSKRSRSDRPAS